MRRLRKVENMQIRTVAFFAWEIALRAFICVHVRVYTVHTSKDMPIAIATPANISGQKLIWMASFMLPLGLDYVQ